ATPASIEILPSSSITASVTADGGGTVTASLGPFKVRLGAGSDPAVFHAAVDVALADPSPGADPVSLADWASALDAQLNQTSSPVSCDSSEDGYALDVCAHFPVYLSNDGGATYSPVASSGNNDVILRLPADDPYFDP